VTAKDGESDAVEGASCDLVAKAERAGTTPKLTGRSASEREGQNVAWIDVAGGRLPCDPTSENAGLARTCAGDDAERRRRCGHRVALLVGEVGDECASVTANAVVVDPVRHAATLASDWRPVASHAGSLATVEVIDRRQFERIVSDALDALPVELGQFMDNVAIVVEDHHLTEDLLGLYEGVPLTEREDYGGLVMPDVITLYRRPLCAVAQDLDHLVEEIGVTVVHEVAHHFGIDDDSLHEWGWG